MAFIRYLFCFSFHFATELSELGLPRDCISTGFQHWFNEAVLISPFEMWLGFLVITCVLDGLAPDYRKREEG